MSSIDPDRTLAIICGAKRWPQLAHLKPSDAFGNTATKLRTYFSAADGMALPEKDNVLWLFDDDDNAIGQLDRMNTFLQQRLQALRSPTGSNVAVFLAYVGHGALEDQAYCLLIKGSHGPNLASTSLRVADLAKMLRAAAPESLRVVILDSCFAGAAVKDFQSDIGEIEGEKIEEALTDAGMRGVAVLCAASARNPTRLSESAECTMFGYALLEVLRRGDATIEGPLNLHEVSRLTRRELQQFDNAPRPEVHSPDQHDGDAAHTPIFPNPAHPWTASTSTPRSRRRRRRLMQLMVLLTTAIVAAVAMVLVFTRNDQSPKATGPARYPTEILAGGRQPAKVAIDPNLKAGFVTDEGSDSVAVFDTESRKFVGFVPVGKAPVGIVVDADRHTAYVSNSGDNTISVLDTKSRSTAPSIPMPSQPWALALDTVAQVLYVSTGTDVTLVDLKTQSIRGKISVPSNDVALDTKHRILCIADDSNNAVVVVNIDSLQTVKTIPTNQKKTQNVAVDPDNQIAYAANADSNTVSVVDLRLGAIVETIVVGVGPNAIAVDPGVHAVYVPTDGDGKVSVIDTTTRKVLEAAKTGGSPWGVTIDPNNHHVFVPDGVKALTVLTDVAPSARPTLPPEALVLALPKSLRDASTGCQPSTTGSLSGIGCSVSMSNPPWSALQLAQPPMFAVTDSQTSEKTEAQRLCDVAAANSNVSDIRVTCNTRDGAAIFIYDLPAEMLVYAKTFRNNDEGLAFSTASGY